MHRYWAPFTALLVACSSGPPFDGNDPPDGEAALLGPEVLINPGSVDFGERIFHESVWERMTLTNTGGAALNVDRFDIQGASSFSAILTVPLQVPPAGVVPFLVKFYPFHTGVLEAEMKVYSDALASPAIVAMSVNSGSLGPELAPVAELFEDIDVVYQVPPGATEIVWLFHGLGGDAWHYVDRIQGAALSQAALDFGYGWVATSSVERVEGRWDRADDSSDLPRLLRLRDDLVARGIIDPAAQHRAIGMSGGGRFASWAAMGLGVDVLAILSTEGDLATFDALPLDYPPVFMAIGSNDTWVSVQDGIDNQAALQAAGIPEQLMIFEPTPLTSERLTRIEGITPLDPDTLMLAVEQVGLVDAQGWVVADPNEWPYTDLPAWWHDQGPEIRDQANVAWAGHIIQDDSFRPLFEFFRVQTQPD